jgi:hypothetical protein
MHLAFHQMLARVADLGFGSDFKAASINWSSLQIGERQSASEPAISQFSTPWRPTSWRAPSTYTQQPPNASDIHHAPGTLSPQNGSSNNSATRR